MVSITRNTFWTSVRFNNFNVVEKNLKILVNAPESVDNRFNFGNLIKIC